MGNKRWIINSEYDCTNVSIDIVNYNIATFLYQDIDLDSLSKGIYLDIINNYKHTTFDSLIDNQANYRNLSYSMLSKIEIPRLFGFIGS